MFSKVLILAFVAVASATLNAGLYGAGLGLTGMPVYRTSANYGGLVAANGWGYGANLGRVAGLGALRAGPIGYGLGSGALIAGGIVAPAISTYGAGLGLGLGYKAAGLGLARGLSVGQAGPVNAAVQTISRTVDYTPVPYSGEPAVVQDIDVPPQESPLRINFQSKSSPLALTQQHIPAEPGQVQVTQSEDEPQQVVHNVVRPVYQQVNEVVKPYRTLTQTVEPVIEQTHTNIAQGEGVRLTGLTSGVVGGTGVLAASGLGLAAPAVAKVGGYGLGLGYGLNAGLYGSKIVGSGLGLGYGLGYGRGLGYGSSLYGAGLYGTGLAKSYGVGYGLGSYGLGSGLGYGLSGLSTKILRY